MKEGKPRMIGKKKILYVVEAMGGGIFTYIVELVNGLVNNYDMYIAYAIRPQTPRNYRDYFDQRVHLIEVRNFKRSIDLVKDFKAFIELKMIVKKINPDIIHLHSSKAGVIGRFAFDGKDISLFYTPHGYSFLMQNYKPIKRIAFKMLEKVCAKRKCMTISCSEGEHKETLKLTQNAIYINNAVNLDKLQKMIEQVEIQDHPFTVFTLGRICFQKNPSLFNKIAEAMPDVKFIWIGEGELREELTAINIEITGWIKREQALKLSINADVFILTSLWEGLPVSLLESMYMKKLCVVNNVIGNRDVIHNSYNGVVCNSVIDFIEGINAAREKRAKKLIDRAFEDILEFYNTNVQIEAYDRIYKKVF